MSIKFVGKTAYSYRNGTLNLKIDQITNTRIGGITGKLRLTLVTSD
jgi:hypothetical protein